MRYFFFDITQQSTDNKKTRTVELEIEAWSIEGAYAVKREWEERQSGWWTTGCYLHSNSPRLETLQGKIQ